MIGFIEIFNWEQEGIEITSHLVLEKFRKLEIGKRLLMYAIKEAQKKILKFFFSQLKLNIIKFGFRIVEVKKFPEKIRARCQQCPNGPHGPGFAPCKEKAMELNQQKKIKPSESRLWMFPYFG